MTGVTEVDREDGKDEGETEVNKLQSSVLKHAEECEAERTSVRGWE